MMYILDTNSAYYLPDRAWTSSEQLARLLERAEAGQLQIGLSPITVLELSSRIAEQPDWFAKVKQAAATLESLHPIPLPDPEQRMREITENVVLARQSYEHWGQILQTVAHAPDAFQLQRGFNDYTSATRRSGNIQHIAQFRASYEYQYVHDLLQVVREINPGYDEQVLRGKTTKLPKDEVNALETFFASPEWIESFTLLLACRGGTGVAPTNKGQLAVVLKKSKFFRAGYESLAISTFRDGQRPSPKRQNDYNDMHQLLYVSEFTKDIVVSEDHGILQKVGSPDGKVISHKAFLAKEAA